MAIRVILSAMVVDWERGSFVIRVGPEDGRFAQRLFEARDYISP
jgi:hypothetical protein